jgi:hypothetical protein
VFLNHFSLICLQSSKLRKWTNSKSRMWYTNFEEWTAIVFKTE